MFDTNVPGLPQVTHAALEHLREGASIINIGSIAGFSRPPWLRFCTATKGAIDWLTRVFADVVTPDEIGNIAVLLASLRAGPVPLTLGLLRDGSLWCGVCRC